jgi:hypothetical protein
MICPYCAVEMEPKNPDRHGLHGATQMWYTPQDGKMRRVSAVACPRCEGVMLLHSDITLTESAPGEASQTEENVFLLLPRSSGRKPLPPEVIEPYRSLYEEAALILQDSPRASAALSRRCLQQLLRDEVHVEKGDLYNEIEWALNNAHLPSYVSDPLHDLRRIGNMAAHPNKSTATGDTLEVEPNEAEWTLDTLDVLFGHLFVEPARLVARRAALAARGAP